VFIGAIINDGIKRVVARAIPGAVSQRQESFAEAGIEVKLVETG